MNRLYCFFVLFFGLPISVISQEIYFYESRIIDTNILIKTGDSYEHNFKVIKGDSTFDRNIPNLGLFWSPIGDNSIVGSNCYIIGSFSFCVDVINQLFESKHSIIELTSNNKYCYFVTALFEQERFENPEIYYMDVVTGHVEPISMPDSINFLNLSVSPSDKYLAFISKSIKEYKTIDYLMLYNIAEEKLTTIDSIEYRKGFFAHIDDGPLINWSNDDIALFYYKKHYDNSSGNIYKYTLSNKLIVKELEVKDPRLRCFGYYDNRFYFTDGDKIYSTDKNGKDSVLYMVKYKFDYIQNSIFIR